MAQWKRAGPITQRSVDRNYFLLLFSRISERKEFKTVTSQVNKREYGKIYTTWPQKNHNTRSRVLKIPNTSRMAQWKRAGHITQRSVDRNYFLKFFFKNFGGKRNQNSYIKSQQEEYGKIYTTWPQKNHNTRSRVLKIPNTSRMAQWKRAGPITQRSVDRNYLLLIFFKAFSERGNQSTYLTNQQERSRRNLHFIAYEPQYKI